MNSLELEFIFETKIRIQSSVEITRSVLLRLFLTQNQLHVISTAKSIFKSDHKILDKIGLTEIEQSDWAKMGGLPKRPISKDRLLCLRLCGWTPYLNSGSI